LTIHPGEDVYPELDLFPGGIGGGIFTHGSSGLLRLGEVHVIAAYLGDLLIWDGTVSAFVSAPVATATALSPVPAVQSQPPTIEAPAATATADAAVPTLMVSSSIAAPVATATADAPIPVVSADAVIEAPAATANAIALPPMSDANIAAPAATATAAAPVPGIATTGSTNISAPPATAAATAPVPTVSASVTIEAPAATASAAAPIPVVSAGVTVTAPAATATAAAPAPTVAVLTFQPSGMTKNSTQAWATSSTWVQITSWSANTGTYPGSTVTSSRLDVQGSKTNADLAAAVPYTGGQFLRQHRCRLVDQSGGVIATGAIVAADTGTCTVTATGVDLTGITSIAVEMNSSGSGSGTVTSGSTCNLTIT
jgi:hypothetical protein